MCVGLKMNYKYDIISKREIEDSLIEYNNFGLTTIDYDQPLNALIHFNTFDEIKYIFGILISIASIYYFVVETCKSIMNR